MAHEPALRTIVIVTASNDRQAAAVEQELAARQQSGAFGPHVIFFAVPDPSSARVGSGGATFNALITVLELISVRPEWSLDNCRIFMIHSGGDSQRLPSQSVCGKAWSALPVYNASQDLDAPIDLLLHKMFALFGAVRSGLVVASSDVLLLTPPGFQAHWPAVGATGLAIPSPKHLGPNHGVYQTAPEPISSDPASRHCRVVTKFWQKASVPELEAAAAVRGSDGTVLLDTGVIYFSPPATAALVELARTFPLDCCSYLGVDQDRAPLRVELYSDVMLAMGGGMGLTKDEYLQTPTAAEPAQAAALAQARSLLWETLTGVPFFATVAEGGGFCHVGTTAEYLQLLTAPSAEQRSFGLQARAAWFEAGAPVAGTCACAVTDPDEVAALAAAAPSAATGVPGATAAAFTVQNSLFRSAGGHRGRGSVVEHSELAGDWRVGSGCLVSCARSLRAPWVRDGIALQETRVGPGGAQRVVTVLGVADPIKEPFGRPGARLCGARWADVLALGGVAPADIWGEAAAAAPGSCTIWTARLFPVFAAPASLAAAGAAGGAGADGEPLSLEDRASLWLQWALLAAAAAPADAAASQPQPAWAARFPGAKAAFLDDPAVAAAWRAAPRMSLRDLLAAADAAAEFGWRRRLRGALDVQLLLGAVTDARAGGVCVTELVARLGRGGCAAAVVNGGEGGGGAGAAAVDDDGGGVSPPAAAASFAASALRALDAAAATAPPDVAGRALAVQSALLWELAGWGGHAFRSGPAHNRGWLAAFALLEGSEAATAAVAAAATGPTAGPTAEAALLEGVAAGGGADTTPRRARAVALLARLRDQWLSRPHLAGRAARHYERAAQLLTAQCVYTAAVTAPAAVDAVTGAPAAPAAGGAATAAAAVPLPLGAWATASCPARIDLAGGWSDTPPVTFEAPAPPAAAAAAAGAGSSSGNAYVDAIAACAARGGGLVVNVGVTVDGVQPIGTRSRRTAAPAAGAAGEAEGAEAGLLTVTIRTRALPRNAVADLGAATAAAAAASGDGAPGSVVSTLVLHTLRDLQDYNQPHAEGAIVKCALLLLGGVRLPSLTAFAASAEEEVAPAAAAAAAGAAAGGGAAPAATSLSAQLRASAGASIEVETWSLLPHGSGLGGSSILSATVLASLARLLGRQYDLPSLTHLVLKVEQMLSTGGGWQDQVGGVYPGVKASSCPAGLPVAVSVLPLACTGAGRPAIALPRFPFSPESAAAAAAAAAAAHDPASAAAAAALFVDPALAAFLDAHLVLVYTGRTRLAKNLLQRVLRQWAVREGGVTQRVAALRATAVALAAALAARDAAALGAALSAYWEQKKGMAPLAEPPEVTALIHLLREGGLIHGCSLTGAGGGGFMVLVCRSAGGGRREVDALLRRNPQLQGHDFRTHACAVDARGLVVSVASAAAGAAAP